MNELQFDTGVVTYIINGTGELRFNPGDPNVYARFMEAQDKFSALDESLSQKANDNDQSGEYALKLLTETDEKAKEILSWVFGAGNDFDKILDGVSLLAPCKNGKRVVENLMEALEPIVKGGIENCIKAQTQEAVEAAKERRLNQA